MAETSEDFAVLELSPISVVREKSGLRPSYVDSVDSEVNLSSVGKKSFVKALNLEELKK